MDNIILLSVAVRRNINVNIEMCLLLTVFNLAVFAADCVVSRTVIHHLTCG